VTSSHVCRMRLLFAGCVLMLTWTLSAASTQSDGTTGSASAVLQGHVRDEKSGPVVNATVSLRPVSGASTIAKAQTIHTDQEGVYHFSALPGGTYTLHAELTGVGEASFSPVTLTEQEVRTIDLVLTSPAASQRPTTQAPAFFDEPQFTVAGVTQATNSGGHGSDTVLRTTEALAKATASLSEEPIESLGSTAKSASTETSLRDAVTHTPENADANRQLAELLVAEGKASEAVPYIDRASRLKPQDAALHHLRAQVDETLGDPLAAVREYQRAAELDPSEIYLFDWGSELLTHRALEPATEVFNKGTRLFPKSVRMLVALGVSWYAREFYDNAMQCLVSASDLDTENPMPYIFLGRMQNIGTTVSEKSVDTLARFARLQPRNALANYYYAVSLRKQFVASADQATERAARAESLLQTAVQLDPRLGAAYLQLGILYSQRADFPQAIWAYQKAIEFSPEGTSPQDDETLVEAHYRLAQAYRRSGDKLKAQVQLKLHDDLYKKTKENIDRQRRDLQQFVISLRDEKPVSSLN
jgi:tetratricopeptide (TPR) repeat protein